MSLVFGSGGFTFPFTCNPTVNMVITSLKWCMMYAWPIIAYTGTQIVLSWSGQGCQVLGFRSNREMWINIIFGNTNTCVLRRALWITGLLPSAVWCPVSLVEKYLSFGEGYCLHLQGRRINQARIKQSNRDIRKTLSHESETVLFSFFLLLASVIPRPVDSSEHRLTSARLHGVTPRTHHLVKNLCSFRLICKSWREHIQSY
jgi:hypothetical protein